MSTNSTQEEPTEPIPPIKLILPWYFPLFYLAVLVSVFWLFIRWNKQRRLNKLNPDGYFGPHLTRKIYLELSEQYSLDDPLGRKLLTHALMQRAIEDVRRATSIQQEKPSLSNLVRTGALSEDFLDKIVQAEKQLDGEVEELMEESEMYRKGWKNEIFKEAGAHYTRRMQMEATLRLQQENAEKQNQKQNDNDNENENGLDEAPLLGSPVKELSNKDNLADEKIVELSSEPKGETPEERSDRIMRELIQEDEDEKRKKAHKKKSGIKYSKKK